MQGHLFKSEKCKDDDSRALNQVRGRSKPQALCDRASHIPRKPLHVPSALISAHKLPMLSHPRPLPHTPSSTSFVLPGQLFSSENPFLSQFFRLPEDTVLISSTLSFSCFDYTLHKVVKGMNEQINKKSALKNQIQCNKPQETLSPSSTPARACSPLPESKEVSAFLSWWRWRWRKPYGFHVLQVFNSSTHSSPAPWQKWSEDMVQKYHLLLNREKVNDLIFAFCFLCLPFQKIWSCW